ncbi:hypothetical protein G6O69_32790 [Pseudenhygromyxa sp. WMMC2535]|uniref:hypothetical protein n=1 Tax=Pseudenhygromyxa sp. WMMC2535 TaxID=2712867 RepID=UPI001556D29A|nr:hypothetical protein [Pseudenhygromyxa sp. WMMC2535]NVB42646.1 hypothetical protein [Pseudenhygromyxa sp. WMMC2535]
MSTSPRPRLALARWQLPRRGLSPSALLCLALVALTCLLSACAPSVESSGPLWADPGVIRMSPARGEVEVVIHNRSSALRPIADYTLAGQDWDGFRFVDESLPRTIPGEDAIVITIAASPRGLRDAQDQLRAGAASLRFRSDHHDYDVPIVYSPGPSGGLPSAGLSVGLGLLAFAVMIAIAGRGAWARLWPRLASPDASPARRQRAALSLAIAAFSLLVALIPLGPGLCADRLVAMVGAQELAQCRAGLGGRPMAILAAEHGAAEPGLLWLWAALLTATVTTLAALGQRRGALAELALPCLRLLGLSLLLPALFVALAPAAPSLDELVVAQTRATPMLGLEGPRWGLIAQPLGFALAFFLVATAGPEGREHPEHPDIFALLRRLDALLWTAPLVVLYLAGGRLPHLGSGLAGRPPLLLHGAELVVTLVVFALELGALLWLGERLRRWLSARLPDPALRLRLHLRVTMPLVFVVLVASLVLR